MTEEEKQARIAELKKIPQRVQMAAPFAFALGILTLLRVLAHAYAEHLPLGKACSTASCSCFGSLSLAARSILAADGGLWDFSRSPLFRS